MKALSVRRDNMLWKRIKLEDFEFPVARDFNKEYIEIEKELPLGVVIKDIKKNDNSMVDNFNIEDYRGLGDKFTTYVHGNFNSGIYLDIPRLSLIHI